MVDSTTAEPSAEDASQHGSHHGSIATTTRLRRVFLPPRLAQDWGQEQHHRQATWGELFYDLFFVVASINLSHLIEKEPNARGIGIFFLYYSAFWFTWTDRTVFQTRVITEGLAVEVVDLVHMLGVLGMVLHCSDKDYFPQFAGSYAVATGTHCALLVVTATSLPRARWMSIITFGFLATVLALAILAVFFSWHAFVALISVSHAVQVLVPLAGVFTPAQVKLPVHVDHMNERFGLMMMIFLGETIVGLGQQVLSDTVEQYTGILLGAVIVWNLHMVYFHTSPNQDHHALRLSRWRGFTWSYAHWLLGGLFLMLGATIRMTLGSWQGVAETTHRLNLRMLLGAAAEHPAEEPPLYPTGEAPDLAEAGGHKVHRDDIGHNVSWILCFAYSFSLHLMLVIRGSHYWSHHHHTTNDETMHLKSFSLFKALGVTHLTNIWWTMLVISPFIVYFIPFAAQDLGAIGLLGYVAAHGFIYNIVETLITHRLVEVVVKRLPSLAPHSAPPSGLLQLSSHGAGKDGSAHVLAHATSSPSLPAMRAQTSSGIDMPVFRDSNNGQLEAVGVVQGEPSGTAKAV